MCPGTFVEAADENTSWSCVEPLIHPRVKFTAVNAHARATYAVPVPARINKTINNNKTTREQVVAPATEAGERHGWGRAVGAREGGQAPEHVGGAEEARNHERVAEEEDTV